ncbi:growth-regulating factor 7-like [Rutidosis leptorrhynchoides]|uniref:growth-regulating factor 7-like n=1 Tax=Rutidosis leptorrhynchoides TaxID=125765 RepID=UPI003A9A5737
MDFGGLGRLLSSDSININIIDNNTSNNSKCLTSGYDLDPNPKSYGFKHERSPTATAHNQDLKVPKITHDCFSKTMLQQQLRSNSSNSVFSDSQNMLSFSSPNTQQTSAFPYFYARHNTGCGGNICGVLAGLKGPFTPSQWMELEHQALIFKYITVNAPIPSNLLIPIRKALESASFSSNLRHTTYGWGGFHLGFSNSSDPEPGRCRRTDGKKWRCSRDAVADQKYCEKHMNRGRHRSRKPVEGQTGHSVSNGSTTAAAAKVSTSAAVVSNTIINHLHQQNQQLNNKMQPAIALNPAPCSNDNRSFLNKENTLSAKKEATDAMLQLSSMDLKQNPLSEFGLVFSDSLVNPLHKTNNEVEKSKNSLRQFMDDWPQSEKTQLSISIPMASTDFMLSNSSPLRMGLGVGNTNTSNTNVFDERSQQVNWIPVSWETSLGGLGGPLGEVLNHSTNNSPPALDLMTDGWGNSQHMTLSPTGVLQKTAFGCFSNSSTGSSPRTDNSFLGSTLFTSSLPLL